MLGGQRSGSLLRFQWTRAGWLVPALLGALLAVLPHLAQRTAHGMWTFLADNDDVYYAMIARAPFYGGWAVRDPFASATEAIPVSYAWGLFVPVAKLASLVADSPAGFLLAWRLLGGFALGLGLWCFVERLGRRLGRRFAWLGGAWGTSWTAALLSAFMLCDPGLFFGTLPLERLLPTLAHVLDEAPVRRTLGWYVQFRVVSPLCGAGAMLGVIALSCQPRASRRSVAVAGLLLGVLFNLYFFFWTAVVAWLSLLLLSTLTSRALRRFFGAPAPGRLAAILAIGLALGLPQLLSDASSFGDPVIREALERTPRGIALALNNPSRWTYLTSARLWVMCLLSGLAAYRVRALRAPALLVGVSFALGNSALVTGLEFENYKWLHVGRCVSFVLIWLWLLAELKDVARARRGLVTGGRLLLTGGLAVCALVAGRWIWRDALRAQESVEHTRWVQEAQALVPSMRQLDPGSLLVAPIEAQPLLLATRAGVLNEKPHSVSSFVSDAEFIERDVLSAWILGRDPDQIDRQSDMKLSLFGESRPRWLERRPRYQAQVVARSPRLLDRYHVRYAVNRCGLAPAADSGDWRELSRSEHWCLWQRVTSG